ncbi:MAG: hypothetical protein PHT99_01305 [Methanoregula sp.]|nr:hypothetical protein [Methanoregula sp.]
MRTQLLTWDGKVAFEYERREDGTIAVTFGENGEYSRSIDGLLYDRLVRTFAGKTVRLNHCLSEENIEDWLTKNGVRTRINQYLAPVLRHEGYIVEGTRRGTITFK